MNLHIAGEREDTISSISSIMDKNNGFIIQQDISLTLTQHILNEFLKMYTFT